MHLLSSLSRLGNLPTTLVTVDSLGRMENTLCLWLEKSDGLASWNKEFKDSVYKTLGNLWENK